MSRLPLIAAIGVAIGAAGYFAFPSSSPETGISLGAVQAQESSEVDTSIVQEMTMGNPDAAVTVVEYASYTCPHCADWHAGASIPDHKHRVSVALVAGDEPFLVVARRRARDRVRVPLSRHRRVSSVASTVPQKSTISPPTRAIWLK